MKKCQSSERAKTFIFSSVSIIDNVPKMNKSSSGLANSHIITFMLKKKKICPASSIGLNYFLFEESGHSRDQFVAL